MLSRRQFFKRTLQTVGIASIPLIGSTFLDRLIEKFYTTSNKILEATVKFHQQDKWKHIAIIRHNNAHTFYINGYEVAEHQFKKEIPGIQLPNKNKIQITDIVQDDFHNQFKGSTYFTGEEPQIDISELTVTEIHRGLEKPSHLASLIS